MNLPGQFTKGVHSDSPEQTRYLAAEIAALLPENSVLLLEGQLGAGKTTFVKGLAHAWGIEQEVTSPTFAICQYYQGARQLVHIDAYRLQHPAEAEDFLDDAFLNEPWCIVVEWPANLPVVWPGEVLRIQFEQPGDEPYARILKCVR